MSGKSNLPGTGRAPAAAVLSRISFRSRRTGGPCGETGSRTPRWTGTDGSMSFVEMAGVTCFSPVPVTGVPRGDLVTEKSGLAKNSIKNRRTRICQKPGIFSRFTQDNLVRNQPITEPLAPAFSDDAAKYNSHPTPGRNGQGGQYHTEIGRRLPWSCSSSSMVMEYSHFPCPLYTGFGLAPDRLPGAVRSGSGNRRVIRRGRPGDCHYISLAISSGPIVPSGDAFTSSRNTVRHMPSIRRKPDLRPDPPIRPRRGFGVGLGGVPTDFNRFSFPTPCHFTDFTSIHHHVPYIPRSLPCPS